MKTPEEIAREKLPEYIGDSDTSDGFDHDDMRSFAVAAIEADRAQHNLIECIAKALDDRGAKDAARIIRDNDPDDDLWNNYVGPMLDSIEDDCACMVREDRD